MIIFLKVISISLAILPISLAQVAPTFNVQTCMSSEVNGTCGASTCKVVKPMLEYFAQINKEMELKNENLANLSHYKELCFDQHMKLMRTLTKLNDELDVKDVVANDACQNNLKGMIEEIKDKQKYLPNGCPNMGEYSGAHVVNVEGLQPFPVSCDSKTAGPGWTIIQRRIDGSVNFHRNWKDYKNGFGNIEKEFFIGLDRLHALTNSQRYELYIELVDQKEVSRYARYNKFVIGNEEEEYKLKSIGQFEGNAGNSMSGHVGFPFSTYDRDNDSHFKNCAAFLKGGWWYFKCADSNLNGKRFDCAVEDSNKLERTGCVFWQHWHGRSYSLKSVKMMIRPFYYKN